MKNKIIFVLSSTLLVAAYASHNENYHSSDFNWNVGSGYIKSESDDDRYKLVKESNESDDAYERNRDNDSDHGNDRDNDNHDSGSDNDNHDSGSDNDNHDSGSDNDNHDSGSDNDNHDD